MQITGDVIKSGGEWISTIDLGARCRPSEVAEAAVIGVPHPRWDERPLLVVAQTLMQPAKSDILGFMDGKVAKWWMPDDVVFVEEIRTRPPAKSRNRPCGNNSGYHADG